MALTAARTGNVPERIPKFREPPVAEDAVIWTGAHVALNAAGYLVPASEALGLLSMGLAEESVDNTGGDNGDLTCRVRAGCFTLGNSEGADEITVEDIGKIAYMVDDETIALTDDGGTRSPAGPIFDVNDVGVWVKLGETDAAQAALAGWAYTPTLTGVTNVDTATLIRARYVRVGKTVMVDVEASVDPTADAVTQVRITLPVPLAVANANEINGVATVEGGTIAGSVKGDVTNDAALLDYDSGGTGAQTWRAHFSYVVA
jgi:hypothetical protein